MQLSWKWCCAHDPFHFFCAWRQSCLILAVICQHWLYWARLQHLVISLPFRLGQASPVAKVQYVVWCQTSDVITEGPCSRNSYEIQGVYRDNGLCVFTAVPPTVFRGPILQKTCSNLLIKCGRGPCVVGAWGKLPPLAPLALRAALFHCEIFVSTYTEWRKVTSQP